MLLVSTSPTEACAAELGTEEVEPTPLSVSRQFTTPEVGGRGFEPPRVAPSRSGRTRVGERGVEPPTLSGQAPKACAFASFATRPLRDASTSFSSAIRPSPLCTTRELWSPTGRTRGPHHHASDGATPRPKRRRSTPSGVPEPRGFRGHPFGGAPPTAPHGPGGIAERFPQDIVPEMLRISRGQRPWPDGGVGTCLPVPPHVRLYNVLLSKLLGRAGIEPATR